MMHEKDDNIDIGNKLRSAQACIGLAAELLTRPDTLASFSDIEIYKLERELRSVRGRMFPKGYFADVAWDVMVDLFVAGNERRKLSIADLVVRNKVPLSTLLRYLAVMEEDGLIYRIPDHHDKRRVFIKLTPAAEEKLKHTAGVAKSSLNGRASVSVASNAN